MSRRVVAAVTLGAVHVTCALLMSGCGGTSSPSLPETHVASAELATLVEGSPSNASMQLVPWRNLPMISDIPQ